MRSILGTWLVLAGVWAGGCAKAEAEPVAVARTFAEAARRSDVQGMMAVLERPAVDQLEQAAERASDQVGGRRNIEPAEMLQIVGVDRTIAVAGAELLDQDERLAHVELTTTDGRAIRIELVWEPSAEAESANEGEPAGSWKVRVPLPGLAEAGLAEAGPAGLVEAGPAGLPEAGPAGLPEAGPAGGPAGALGGAGDSSTVAPPRP